MFKNPERSELTDILKQAKTIAIVGLSDKPDRDSYGVAQQLQARGYRIIPVNPQVSSVLGEPAYARLQDIPVDIDIIDVFRRSDALTAVVEEALGTNAPVIWAQEGVYDEAAANLATEAGKVMVMDLCIAVAHSVLVRGQA